MVNSRSRGLPLGTRSGGFNTNMEILQTILLPITVPLGLFIYFVYGKDSNDFGWYQRVWKGGSLFEKILGVLISPLVWFALAWLFLLSAKWDEILFINN